MLINNLPSNKSRSEQKGSGVYRGIHGHSWVSPGVRPVRFFPRVPPDSARYYFNLSTGFCAMNPGFRPATRAEAKPLIGLYSESGCGKTWSALLLARGFAGPLGRIGMIETEAGRGEAY